MRRLGRLPCCQLAVEALFSRLPLSSITCALISSVRAKESWIQEEANRNYILPAQAGLRGTDVLRLR